MLQLYDDQLGMTVVMYMRFSSLPSVEFKGIFKRNNEKFTQNFHETRNCDRLM